jgi:hypothetical protein
VGEPSPGPEDEILHQGLGAGQVCLNTKVILAAGALIILGASIVIVESTFVSGTASRSTTSTLVQDAHVVVGGSLTSDGVNNHLNYTITVTNRLAVPLVITGYVVTVINETLQSHQVLNLGWHVNGNTSRTIAPGATATLTGASLTLSPPSGPAFSGKFLKVCTIFTSWSINVTAPTVGSINGYSGFAGWAESQLPSACYTG